MLREEVERRTGVAWVESATLQPHSITGCAVLIGTEKEVASFLPLADINAVDVPSAPESYSVRTEIVQGKPLILAAGRDQRGVLFAAGALLRKLSLRPGRASLDAPLQLRAEPQKSIRSHQIGYRAKNNTYDAWNLTQFELQIRDLAIFGANTVQLIAPVSDDAAASPLFPASPMETLIGISGILERYGLHCDLYYPEMETDYSRPQNVERELGRFEDLVRRMPLLDVLWVPGGDPGHTRPAMLFPLIGREAAILRRYHPHARVYVSAQGMDREQYEEFYRLVQQPPVWLSGVFFGPQSRDSFEVQRRRIPSSLPMVFYPDIGHTMHAQFPVPQWDPAIALTEGREPIDPRPVDEGIIYRHFAPLHIGFVTYSEGVNDDVNKMLWSQWGWNADLPAGNILEDYARLYVGPGIAEQFADALMTLEQNWRGPLIENAAIAPTLESLRAIQGELPAGGSWRFKMALYRACYDAYLQQRLRFETQQQDEALRTLRRASELGPETAMRQAEQVLERPLPQNVHKLQAEVFQLGGELFRAIGLQLSTKLYGASNWERGANLDRIDIPLNDRIWLQRTLVDIRAQPASRQLDAVSKILAHYEPPPGGFLDDLGDPRKEPHMVRGAEYADDPEMYSRAIDGVADHTPEDGWRWAELTYAEALYEYPLQLHYEALKPGQTYRLRVVYAGEDYAVPVRLLANHTFELQPFTVRQSNPQEVEYEIPANVIERGTLLLEWTAPDGLGGSGRGRQIAEVILFPKD